MGMCIINTNESSEFLGELGRLPCRVDSDVDSNRNPDLLFFQQKPGAMLMLKLILPNEWGFLGSPNVLLKFSSFLSLEKGIRIVSNKVYILKKMLESVRWWMIGNWKTKSPYHPCQPFVKEALGSRKIDPQMTAPSEKWSVLTKGPPLVL